MVDRATCSECGAAIAPDARTLGLCPRCLIAGAGALAGEGRAASGPAPMFDPPSPEQLAGQLPQFEIHELIGQGGMGAVYRARQISLDRAVALKIFPRQAGDDPAAGERFAQEARVVASFSHPNIITAHEFGSTAGYWYLVMELVPGPSLRQIMQTQRALPDRIAIPLATQICEALSYAHGRGVIHRDIKPENVLLQPGPLSPPGALLDSFFATGGRVRVADFGLAKLMGPRPIDFTLTAPAQRLGTIAYMAPEQQRGAREIDARADVWAVGVVLYEMLTGELPQGSFAPPSQTPGVDARLDAIVLRCLKTNPDDRYPSAAALRQELESLSRPPARFPLKALIAAGAVAAIVVAVLLGWRLAHHRPVIALPTSQPATAPAATPVRPPPPWLLDRERDYLDRMIAQHGANRVVSLYIDGLPGDVRSFILERVGQISGASNTVTSGSTDSLTIHLAPVGDIEALARKVDFGTVVAIDKEKHAVQVRADPARLPPPLPPAIKDVKDPAFYTQNLAELSSWDRHRRREAAGRLKTAPTTQPREPVARALLAQLAETDEALRRDALDALRTWAGPEAVDPLIALLKDPDRAVHQKAMELLGKLGDARAAQPLADALAIDRRNAAEALKALGPPAEDVVLAQLKNTDPGVRQEAARVLGVIGTSKCLPALQESADARDGLVTMFAAASLKAVRARIGGEK